MSPTPGNNSRYIKRRCQQRGYLITSDQCIAGQTFSVGDSSRRHEEGFVSRKPFPLSTRMIRESSDAQMLDYQNDHDFSMQVSSSDTWLQHEALMEDDDPAVVGIEVDMEAYGDKHNPEYEMADGDFGSPEIASPEPVDVEVYDVFQTQSLDPPDDHETLTLPATELVPVPSAFHELPESVSQFSSVVAHTFYTLVPSESTTTLEVLAQPLQPEVDDGQSHGLDGVGTTLSTTVSQPDEEYRLSTSATSSFNQPEEENPFERAPLVNDNPEESESFEANASYYDTAQGGASTTHEGHLETKDDIPGVESDSHVELESSRTSIGDPHEISEGVYIDPPPPVLLSFSANLPCVSLFNVPSLSQPGTPRRLETPLEPNSSSPVLLSHLPTLYYEPLSSVFAALRQDEHLANVPDISRAELILDAYDLDLVISEVRFSQKIQI